MMKLLVKTFDFLKNLKNNYFLIDRSIWSKNRRVWRWIYHTWRHRIACKEIIDDERSLIRSTNNETETNCEPIVDLCSENEISLKEYWISPVPFIISTNIRSCCCFGLFRFALFSSSSSSHFEKWTFARAANERTQTKLIVGMRLLKCAKLHLIIWEF